MSQFDQLTHQSLIKLFYHYLFPGTSGRFRTLNLRNVIRVLDHIATRAQPLFATFFLSWGRDPNPQS
jgi:hypothetical protein